MKHTSLIIAAILAILAPVLAMSADTEASDAALVARLAETTDVDARSELVYVLQERSSDQVRMALEAIASDTAEPGDIRMLALCGLAASATSQTVPLVIDILERDLTNRTGLWACAIPLLGDIGDRRAAPLLYDIAALNEEHLAGMDHMAIRAISWMAVAKDAPFLETKAHITPVRSDVMIALARLGEISSVDVLISGLLEGEDPEVIEAASEGLMKMGEAALPHLKVAIETYPDEVLRARAQKLAEALE